MISAEYVPTLGGNAYERLAFKRIQDRAVEAFLSGQHDAAHLELEGRAAVAHAVNAVLAAVGRAYAAAAISGASNRLIDKLDEDTYVSLGETAVSLDLEVIEDLEGANGTGEDA